MDSETLRNRRLEGVWEVLGATLAPKFYQNLSWTSLVDFGRARSDQNLTQMTQNGIKLEPRWHQDNPSWSQDGHLEATWGSMLSILGGLGSDI